jgi:hypothetical protein
MYDLVRSWSVGLISAGNCQHLSLVSSPPGLMTIFYCLTTLGVVQLFPQLSTWSCWSLSYIFGTLCGKVPLLLLMFLFAMGLCLMNCCLAVDISSGFAVPVLTCHVSVLNFIILEITHLYCFFIPVFDNSLIISGYLPSNSLLSLFYTFLETFQNCHFWYWFRINFISENVIIEWWNGKTFLTWNPDIISVECNNMLYSSYKYNHHIIVIP